MEISTPEKRRLTGRVADIIGATLIGAVFGPVAMAVVGAAFASAKSDNGWAIESVKLVEAYQSRLRLRRLLPGSALYFTADEIEDGAECGYEPDVVFPDGIRGLGDRPYNDYVGYYALDMWRDKNREEARIRSVTWDIDRRFSRLETGFLRRCIQGTLFASVCMDVVERVEKSTPPFARGQRIRVLGDGSEDRVVCTFVDGVAARRGIALASSRLGTD